MISRRELALLLTGAAATAAVPSRSVAITIDDLPRGGDWPNPSGFDELRALNREFLAPFKSAAIPLTGFVTSSRMDLAPPQLDRVLRLWLEAGAELGNHTAAHPDFNTMALEAFEADAMQCDTALRRSVKPRYFRHTFLHAGPDKAKRSGFEKFLAAHSYRIAPVTLDNSDCMFAAVYGHAVARGDRDAAGRARLPYLESIFSSFALG